MAVRYWPLFDLAKAVIADTVNTFAELPATADDDVVYIVLTSTGSRVLLNRKLSGLYRFYLGSWIRLSENTTVAYDSHRLGGVLYSEVFSSARDRANHTGTQVAATISDFDDEVDNNLTVEVAYEHVTSTGEDHTFIDQDVTSTASPTFVDVNPTGLVDGRDVAVDGNKLDGIEAGAEANNISDADATDLTDGGATVLHKHYHNNLSGLQGGAVGDYQHLTTAQVAEIAANTDTIATTADSSVIQTAASSVVSFSYTSGVLTGATYTDTADITNNSKVFAYNSGLLETITHIFDYRSQTWTATTTLSYTSGELTGKSTIIGKV